VTRAGSLLVGQSRFFNDFHSPFQAKDTYTPTSLEGPFANIIDAYGTSKAAALAATERFVQEEKPTWDVVNILPSLVVGRNELNDGPEQVASGGNATPMGVLLETKNDIPTLGVSVHVDDVARAHIDALRPSIPGNRNYIFSVDTTWDDAKDIARRHFREAVQKRVLPLVGSQPSRPLHFDTSETEAIFGWRLSSFEEQIKSVAGQYVDLVAAQ
jgi:nucleoside-diphosphate-sugar epimerase